LSGVVTTLVVCVDRTDDVGRKTGLSTPVAGWEAVRSLVTDVGLADPEDSAVNSLLEALRVARDLREDGDDAVVAVVSGGSDSVVGADRAVAQQLDDLIATHDPDSAIVVIDSAQDERLVPIVESRLQVDSVDRVVVRQARDIESTYYLIKQFLADEELRQTVLVPIGVALVVFPILALVAGPAVGFATITAVMGLFLLYKGFAVDELVTRLATQGKKAVYSGQVSVVTYVVAAGLTLGGVFAGFLEVSALPETQGLWVPLNEFAYHSVPWLATAALAASTGRLLDEAIQRDNLRASYLNLPFVVLAVGLVVRGFSGYFLERGGVVERLVVPSLELGVVTIQSFTVSTFQRLGLFVFFGLLVSLLGVQVASSLSGTTIEETETEVGRDGADETESSSGS
jgi:putative membrane protein